MTDTEYGEFLERCYRTNDYNALEKVLSDLRWMGFDTLDIFVFVISIAWGVLSEQGQRWVQLVAYHHCKSLEKCTSILSGDRRKRSNAHLDMMRDLFDMIEDG